MGILSLVSGRSTCAFVGVHNWSSFDGFRLGFIGSGGCFKMLVMGGGIQYFNPISTGLGFGLRLKP